MAISSRSANIAGRHPAQASLGPVLVVGAPLAALCRRLPRVLGVSELPLCERVETFLLVSKHVELVLALLGLSLGGVEWLGARGPSTLVATEQPA